MMKKKNRWYDRLRMIAGALVLAAALAAGLSLDAFSITSLADSAGKITATSAKVRQSASTSSNTLASVAKGDTVSVKGQTTGSDGYTWYQVVVNGSGTGYIRSDLMEITDGSTPPAIVNSTTSQTPNSSTPTTSTPDETVVGVTAVEPVSASTTVSGTTGVRVRQNASSTSRIISTVQNGHALTVTGTATGTDGLEWYQVTFISNGSEVNGFIRSDFVSVSGELVPAGTAAQESEETTETQSEEGENTTEVKDGWETYYQDNAWHLLDRSTGNSYDIDNIFSTVKANNETLTEVVATNKTQQIAVIALVILTVILISIISVLIFKIKEMKDDAYYEAVERETAQRELARRRTADRPVQRTQGGQRTSQGSGASRQQTSGQQRSASGVNGNGRQTSGQRPASSRNGNVQRSAGQKSRQAIPSEHAVKQRPAEEEPIRRERYEAELAREERTQSVQERQPVRENAVKQPKEKRKSRNFVNDDEFEFQFLDWDEDQE